MRLAVITYLFHGYMLCFTEVSGGCVANVGCEDALPSLWDRRRVLSMAR